MGKSKAGGRVFVDFSLEKEVGSKKRKRDIGLGKREYRLGKLSLEMKTLSMFLNFRGWT